jgi:hypothetical protein
MQGLLDTWRAWNSLDDVVMGGTSTSTITVIAGEGETGNRYIYHPLVLCLLCYYIYNCNVTIISFQNTFPRSVCCKQHTTLLHAKHASADAKIIHQ